MNEPQDQLNLNHRCRLLIDDLEIPPPITIGRLVNAAAHWQQKPIKITTISPPPDYLCGMLVRTPGVDHIVIDPTTTTSHQLRVVAHQIGHLVLNHAHGSQSVDDVLHDIARTIAPDLAPRVVKDLLRPCVSRHQRQQEHEAETFAHLVMTAARTTARTNGQPAAARTPSPTTSWPVDPVM